MISLTFEKYSQLEAELEAENTYFGFWGEYFIRGNGTGKEVDREMK